MALIIYSSLLICALGAANAAQVLGIPVSQDPKLTSLGLTSSLIEQSRGLQTLPTIGYTSATVQNKNPFSLFSSTLVGQNTNTLPLGFTSNLQYPVEYSSTLVGEYQRPGVTLEKVRALRQWVREQDYLPGDYITDLDLILALNQSNGDVEDAERLVDRYFTVKTLFTDLFQNRFVGDWVEKTLQTAPVVPLPTRSATGDKLLYLNIGKDLENFDLTELCKASTMLLDLSQYLEGSWPGLELVVDLKNFTPELLSKLTPLDIFQQYLYYLDDALLANMKGIHYINSPDNADQLLNVLNSVMSESLRNKQYVHLPGSPTLNKLIPSYALPKEAGGTYKSLEELKQDSLREFLQYQDFFVTENKKRVLQNKRPGKQLTIADVLNSGNFPFAK